MQRLDWPRPRTETGQDLPKNVVNRRTAVTFAWTFAWFVGIWLFGFTIGAPLCTFIQLKIGERERWPLSIILSFVAWAFLYGLFERLLYVPFPEGEIFVWLNLTGS